MTGAQRGAAAFVTFLFAGVLTAASLQEQAEWSAKDAAVAMVLEGAAWSGKAGRLVVIATKLDANAAPSRRRQALSFDGASGFLSGFGLGNEPGPGEAAAAQAAGGAWAKLLEALGYESAESMPLTKTAGDRAGAASRNAGLLGDGGEQGVAGIAIGSDDSVIVFGKRKGAPFASKVNRRGELSWARPVTGISDGFVAAAVPDRDGGTYLAVVSTDERTPSASARSVQIVFVDNRGEAVAHREVPGDSCGMVRDARGVSLVVGSAGKWSLVHLSSKLEPLDQHALDLRIGALWRVAAAPAGDDRIAVLDIDHLQPRITIVDASGRTLLSKRLEQQGLLPTLEMQLVAAGQGDLYAVVPEQPARDATGKVTSGVRVLKLRVSD